ncbi:MAG: HEAT repeat domain-containing protein [Dehalococcoidales bacterium]
MGQSPGSAPSPDAPSGDIQSLVADLASRDGRVRVAAREALVDIGRPAVDSLVGTLADSRTQLRWEAAKALGDIADPAAAGALALALDDKVFDVRWLAAEGLIAIGREALVPVLRIVISCADSPLCRSATHHVLHDLAQRDDDLKETLAPVLAALDGTAPSVEVPLAAETAIAALAGG